MRFLATHPGRLIDLLKERLPNPSAKYLRRVLESNLCRVNGKVERFASAHVEAGDPIELAPSWEKLEKESDAMRVVFEDDHFKVVEKVPGWICSDELALRTFGPRHYLIHRLDKDTSGLLLIAKSVPVKGKFVELFEAKQVSKLYLALADGVFLEESAKREGFFAKKGTFQGQTIWGSAPRGLYACTHFKTLGRGEKATLFACQPITGRTHQIRVHLSELGHPILTDRQYSERFRCRHFFQRTLLHAARLKFTHPITNEPIDLFSPLLGDMRSAVGLVGINTGHLREFLGQEEEDCGSD
ncbi:MAG: RluA family pseudouridine synthase [Verrucomicrobia bacterium]|nr:RluA family pseudouridine synthase [Verrucomicrobiota bacterium]